MRIFIYPVFWLCCILICCPLAAAQEKTKHELFWNGSVFSTSKVADAESSATSRFGRSISVDDFIVIRGKYYDDDDGPIAIFVSLTDANDRVITKYLARIYDKTERNAYLNGGDLLLFGPQFYDGHEIMRVKFTIFRLGKTKAEKVFGQVKKYLPVIPSFIPGANLTNPYTELAMQLIGELIEKDKKNKVAEFELPLRGLDDKAAIPQTWYLFGQGRVAGLIDAETSFDKDSTFHVPILPARMKKDGAALTVGALRQSPDTSYRELLNRLNEVEKSAQENVRSKIPIPSIATGDAQVDQMMLDHIWFSLFAKLRFATDQNNSRAIIRDFFGKIETLSQLTKDGPPTGAFIKLSDEKERLLTQQLIGVFGYRIGNMDLKDGMKKPSIMFTTLEQWRNWFNQRCDLKKDNDPCSFFDWKTENQQQAPYVIATDRYILSKAEGGKKSLDDKVAAKPADNKLLSSSEVRESLLALLKYFQDQPDEPWMFFEQVAVSRWIKQNFVLKKDGATGDDLPEVTLESDPEQLRAFVAALRTAIANTKLLKADGDRYVAYPMGNYVWSELFHKKLVEIQGKDPFQVNQHELLKQSYNSTIGKFWGQLSEGEKSNVKEKFKALFKDKKLQDEYAENESAVFFDKNLLKVTSDAKPLSSADSELLVTLEFYDSYLKSPSQFFNQATRGENKEFKNYLENSKSVADFSRKFISAAGKPLSVRQRAVTFLGDKLVPSLLEDTKLKLIPKNTKEASDWHTEFTTNFLVGKTWDSNCPCFGGNGSEEEQLEALKLIENKFSTFDENTSSEDLKGLLREALEFRFPSQNEPKTTRVKNQALPLLLQFTGLNLDARPELKELKGSWEQTFLSDTANLDIRKCQIGGTEKRIVVVRGQPCPGAPVPGPASQPS